MKVEIKQKKEIQYKDLPEDVWLFIQDGTLYIRSDDYHGITTWGEIVEIEPESTVQLIKSIRVETI